MILELSSLIRQSVEQSLEDQVAVSFSGGLDSTTIATVATKNTMTDLFSCGCEKSQDLEYAEKVAKELSVPLNKVLVSDTIALSTYGKIHSFLPLDFLKLEILIPVYCAAEAAKQKGHSVMLFGAGAEELFIGYDRYYRYHEEGKDLDAILKEEFRTLPQREIAWIKKICKKFNIEARFPLYNRDIADLIFSVPIEDRMEERELKKGILREAAKILGVPSTAIMRKKKAMQYGSGVHKLLLKHSEEINRIYPS
ncbi:asparagine synthase C-terminal domain-containing protein [Candidatus Micrarchaeota archaeon]|nr:asparagine synthase C-terminal domain-containing protein [Candidatus Micrarchaeota archaeon]